LRAVGAGAPEQANIAARLRGAEARRRRRRKARENPVMRVGGAQGAGVRADVGARRCWRGTVGLVVARAYTHARLGPRPVSNETHLSAKEAQASANSWFSRSDADACGTPDAQASATEGSQAAERLIGRFRVTRGVQRPRSDGRLTRSGDFERVFRNGRSRAGQAFVVYVFPQSDGQQRSRLGMSVSRKVGGAVERNRVKRLLREAFRRTVEARTAGLDVVVVARRPAVELAQREGLAGVERALTELLEGLGAGREAGGEREPGGGR
jgi:ribonuclease P protein component